MSRLQPKSGGWIAVWAAVLALCVGGCYWNGDDPSDESAALRLGSASIGPEDLRASGGADVVIRLGGEKAGVPDTIDRIDLRVSGPDFGTPYSGSFDVTTGQEVVIEETFPSGSDVLFEVEALSDNGEGFSLLYAGSTLTDLAPGANDVTVSMEGQAFISGSIYYLDGDGFAPDLANPLAGHIETEGPVEFETGDFGSFSIQVATGADPIRIEANPDTCPVSEEFSPGTEWANCYALAEVVLDTPGDSVYLTMYVVPDDAAIFGASPFLSSIVPTSITVGETLSLYGSSLNPASAIDVGIAFDVEFNSVPVSAQTATDEKLTAVVPSTPGFIDVAAYAEFATAADQSNAASLFVTASQSTK